MPRCTGFLRFCNQACRSISTSWASFLPSFRFLPLGLGLPACQDQLSAAEDGGCTGWAGRPAGRGRGIEARTSLVTSGRGRCSRAPPRIEDPCGEGYTADVRRPDSSHHGPANFFSEACLGSDEEALRRRRRVTSVTSCRPAAGHPAAGRRRTRGVLRISRPAFALTWRLRPTLFFARTWRNMDKSLQHLQRGDIGQFSSREAPNRQCLTYFAFLRSLPAGLAARWSRGVTVDASGLGYLRDLDLVSERLKKQHTSKKTRWGRGAAKPDREETRLAWLRPSSLVPCLPSCVRSVRDQVDVTHSMLSPGCSQVFLPPFWSN